MELLRTIIAGIDEELEEAERELKIIAASESFFGPKTRILRDSSRSSDTMSNPCRSSWIIGAKLVRDTEVEEIGSSGERRLESMRSSPRTSCCQLKGSEHRRSCRNLD